MKFTTSYWGQSSPNNMPCSDGGGGATGMAPPSLKLRYRRWWLTNATHRPLYPPENIWNIAELHPRIPCHFAWHPSTRLTILTIPLTQPHDCSCYVSRQILAPPALRLQKHIDLRAQDSSTRLTCGIVLGSLTLPTPEAREFVKLILLYPLPWSGWAPGPVGTRVERRKLRHSDHVTLQTVI
jgi:hypothetical protein